MQEKYLNWLKMLSGYLGMKFQIGVFYFWLKDLKAKNKDLIIKLHFYQEIKNFNSSGMGL